MQRLDAQGFAPRLRSHHVSRACPRFPRTDRTLAIGRASLYRTGSHSRKRLRDVNDDPACSTCSYLACFSARDRQRHFASACGYDQRCGPAYEPCNILIACTSLVTLAQMRHIADRCGESVGFRLTFANAGREPSSCEGSCLGVWPKRGDSLRNLAILSQASAPAMSPP